MNQDKYFTVKYKGTSNPLIVTLPPNEKQAGQQYVEVECGSFFWSKPLGVTTPIPVPSVRVAIPGLASGNYDITGVNTNIMVQILPNTLWQDKTTGEYIWNYSYSPGRPDLYLCPPAPTIQIGLYDDNNNLIDFTGNSYYISLNIAL
jgi:hypothetical protein